MQARNPFRTCAGARDCCNRKRRGIGGKDAGVADDRFQRRKQRLLGVELFDDRFDDDGAGGQSGKRFGQRDTRDRRIGVLRVDLAFADERCEHVRDRLFGRGGGARLGVDQADLEAGLRADLRDAAPHEAGADDPDDVAANTCGWHECSLRG